METVADIAQFLLVLTFPAFAAATAYMASSDRKLRRKRDEARAEAKKRLLELDDDWELLREYLQRLDDQLGEDRELLTDLETRNSATGSQDSVADAIEHARASSAVLEAEIENLRDVLQGITGRESAEGSDQLK